MKKYPTLKQRLQTIILDVEKNTEPQILLFYVSLEELFLNLKKYTDDVTVMSGSFCVVFWKYIHATAHKTTTKLNTVGLFFKKT